MKKKRKIGFINTGIYPYYVMVSCGYNYSEIRKWLKKKAKKYWFSALDGDKSTIENCHAIALHRTIKGNNIFFIIMTEEFNRKNYQYVELAHEVMHIVQFITIRCNGDDRELECEARLHSCLMYQTLKMFT